MDYEIFPIPNAWIDTGLQDINLVIATITNVSALYTAVVTFYWWARLRNTATNLRPFILAVGLAKTALWFWSLTGMLQILVYDIDLPFVSLPARTLFMFAAVTQMLVTMRYYGHREDPPGPFQN